MAPGRWRNGYSASFSVSDRARSFVELEGGGPEAFGDLIREGPYRPYQWAVRHFREGDPRELRVRFRPDGTPDNYSERLSEDTPGPVLDADAARAIAEGSVGAPWNVDLTEYELVQSSRAEQPSGRVDHTFVYEHSGRQAGEGRFRLRLVVSGDRPTELTHLLQIPEGFDRRYEEIRAANNGIAGGSALAIALLYGVGAVVGLFVLLRRRWVLWRMPLICGVSIAVLQAIAAFNAWPLIWMDYDTAVSESSFAIQQIVTILSSVVLFAILFTLSFMAAESLSRRAFPHHVQFWRCWSRDGARSWPIVGQTAAGYLAVGAMLAFLVAFYWITRSQLGWWSPSDALYQPDSVATVLPWLNPLAISLQAGFWEECLFRAVPLAGAALLGERFGRRRAWIAAAFVVQILVFGAAHANYPAQPAYARLVELILPSAAFGLLYLRFGLLPAIVMHFAFDAVLFSMPLFLSTAAGAWIDQGLFVAIFLLPIWVVLVARVRGGAWIEAPAQLFNGAWQPPTAEPPQTQPQAAPSPRLALPRVSVSAAIALAGLALWAYVAVKPVESPPLEIGRGVALEIAREALAANEVDADEWRELAVVRGGRGQSHRFVWSEAGPEAFRAEVGRYLSSPGWRVRYAQFEGDVAARAEEYLVWIDGNGSVERFEHRLAEDTAGASLEEEAARSIARDALARLDAAADLVEVSARKRSAPNRGRHGPIGVGNSALGAALCRCGGWGRALVPRTLQRTRGARDRRAVIGDVGDWRGEQPANPDERPVDRPTGAASTRNAGRVNSRWRRHCRGGAGADGRPRARPCVGPAGARQSHRGVERARARARISRRRDAGRRIPGEFGAPVVEFRGGFASPSMAWGGARVRTGISRAHARGNAHRHFRQRPDGEWVAPPYCRRGGRISRRFFPGPRPGAGQCHVMVAHRSGRRAASVGRLRPDPARLSGAGGPGGGRAVGTRCRGERACARAQRGADRIVARNGGHPCPGLAVV